MNETQDRERLCRLGRSVSGPTLEAAADTIEEIEATARLWLMLRHERVRSLTAVEVQDLRERMLATRAC